VRGDQTYPPSSWANNHQGDDVRRKSKQKYLDYAPAAKIPKGYAGIWYLMEPLQDFDRRLRRLTNEIEDYEWLFRNHLGERLYREYSVNFLPHIRQSRDTLYKITRTIRMRRRDRRGAMHCNELHGFYD
jgi:hypothetical protein